MKKMTVTQYKESLKDGAYKTNFEALVKEFGEENLNSVFYLEAPCQYICKRYTVKKHIEDTLVSAQESIDARKKIVAQYIAEGQKDRAENFVIADMKDIISKECDALKDLAAKENISLAPVNEITNEKNLYLGKCVSFCSGNPRNFVIKETATGKFYEADDWGRLTQVSVNFDTGYILPINFLLKPQEPSLDDILKDGYQVVALKELNMTYSNNMF